MSNWANDAVFYHLYPLGACGAPAKNDFSLAGEARLLNLLPWVSHAQELGATALYLGPVFESGSHGYDTVDYFRVDQRLGTDVSLDTLTAHARDLGLRVVFEAVFGHVGREFWAFRDLRERGAGSDCRDWFRGVDFNQHNRYGDRFGYEYWKDATELPRLNLGNRAVRKHLFDAVDHWVSRYRIDGLRLDSADWLDPNFLAELRWHCENKWPDLWLLGEIVHGDYRRLVNRTALHSATNYEVYKGLWSSHVDRNFFEIAYSLERQSGAHGMYQGLPLYVFADNHDVNRVASMVHERTHLFSLYCLMFTIPGIPSLYAGSEWGITGVRTPTDDRPLRPHLELGAMERQSDGQDLRNAIQRLIALRKNTEALRRGSYRQLLVASRQLVFLRQTHGETVLVAINAANGTNMTVQLPSSPNAVLTDLLNPGTRFKVVNGLAHIDVPGTWARVLKVEANC